MEAGTSELAYSPAKGVKTNGCRLCHGLHLDTVLLRLKVWVHCKALPFRTGLAADRAEPNSGRNWCHPHCLHRVTLLHSGLTRGGLDRIKSTAHGVWRPVRLIVCSRARHSGRAFRGQSLETLSQHKSCAPLMQMLKRTRLLPALEVNRVL